MPLVFRLISRRFDIWTLNGEFHDQQGYFDPDREDLPPLLVDDGKWLTQPNKTRRPLLDLLQPFVFLFMEQHEYQFTLGAPPWDLPSRF